MDPPIDGPSHEPKSQDQVTIELGNVCDIQEVPEVGFEAPGSSGASQPNLDDSLTPAEKSQLNKDYTRLLDDISGKPESSETTPSNLDIGALKDGFYTAKETPRHFLDNDDISEHHRTGDFPHLRHLMSPGGSTKKRDKGHRGHHKGHRSHKKDKGGSSKDRKRDEEEIKKEEDNREPPLISISEPDEEQSEKKNEVTGIEAPSTDVPDAGTAATTTTSTDHILTPPNTQTSPASQSVGKSDVLPLISEELNDNVAAYESPVFTLDDVTPQTVLPQRLQMDDVGSDSDFSATPTVGFFIGEDDVPSPDPGKRSLTTPQHVPSDKKVAFTFETDNTPVDYDTGKKDKVKFSIGEQSDEKISKSKTMPGELTEGSRSPRRTRRHSKIPSQMDLEARRQRGSEVKLGNRRASLASPSVGMTSEFSQLDLDNMASHRFADSRGLQRRRVSLYSHTAATSVIQVAKLPPKPKHDHNPHELFVELDELHTAEDKHYEWKEKARWIKYEEDVEEGANKWGKPHVSSLSFHSLLDLRKCIEQGVVLLDLEEDNLPAIASCITEELVKSKQLPVQHRGKVLRVLLLKHRHMDQRGFLRRNSTFFQLHSARDERWFPRQHDYKQLSQTDKDRRPSFFSKKTPPVSKRMSLPDTGVYATNGQQLWQGNEGDEESGKYHKMQEPNNGNVLSEKEQAPSISALSGEGGNLPATSIPRNKSAPDTSILKRIPDGAETTSVLVGSVDYLDKPIMAFVRLSEGCDLGNLTEVPLPVRFLFLLMGPPQTRMDYHEIGRSISTLMSNTNFHDVAYMADDRTDLLKALNSFLDDSIVLPPGEIDKKVLLPIIDMAKQREREKKKLLEKKIVLETPPEPPFDPFKRTGRPFGGVFNDVKRRYPQYWSDIKDGVNLQCLATFFFVYFACLSPAITFGGLLSEKTDSYLGVTEMLVGTFACGVVFALLSGQPLLILGGTGPILIFEEGLFQICSTLDIDFLSMRCWVGFWVTIVATTIIAVEGVFLVKYFTRFTEEIFASLISLIFIIEVFIKINQQFKNHPLKEYYLPIVDCTNQDTSTLSGLAQSTASYFADWYTSPTTPEDMNITSNNTGLNSSITTMTPFDEQLCFLNKPNTALLSVILTFGTFFIAYFLKVFRNSPFLGRNARRALGDFGIPIAIVTMLIIDVVIGDKAYTEKLNVPDGFVPTGADKRGWFVNPLGNAKSLPVWAMFAAVIPALLLFILLFMESLITSCIVNKKCEDDKTIKSDVDDEEDNEDFHSDVKLDFRNGILVIVNKTERKLKKGSGYHVDMLLVGLFATFGGVLGTPFLAVATVRSVTHVSALTVFSKSHAPGEKPKLVEVKEQRLTAFLVHIMIGLSTLLGPVLRHIPLAVLFGVFLYMGVASMSGIQLFERVQLLFMPVKHHPDVGYVRKVRLWKMNLFTIIQLFCLALLWVIKSTEAALAFPFVLILMVPVRFHLLKHIFSVEELHELDKSGEDAEQTGHDTDEEPDFYEQAHMPF